MNAGLYEMLCSRNFLWAAACFIIVFVSFVLVWPCRVVPLVEGYDSGLYLRLAESIINGEWLGAYDYLTLIRPPVYPLFIALNYYLHLPLDLFQYSLYLAGALLMVAALRQNSLPRSWTLIVFALTMLHPVALLPVNYVATEAVYCPMTTAIAAACIGIYGSFPFHFWRFFVWSIILSSVLALFFFTRPEGVWILPALGFIFFCIIFLTFLKKEMFSVVDNIDDVHHTTGEKFVSLSVIKAILYILLLIFLCICMWKGLDYSIRSKNKEVYGVKIVTELTDPGFVSAFKHLTRIMPDSRCPYVPVTRKAMEMASKMSSSFNLIYPGLAWQFNGKGWSSLGCNYMNICDELAGGWAVWAIRDAAFREGLMNDAVSSRKFFDSMAQELSIACNSGNFSCSSNMTGNIIAPPLMLSDLPRFFKSTVKIIQMFVTFGNFADEKSPPLISFPQESVERYSRITGSHWPGWCYFGGPYSHTMVMIYKWFQIAGCFVVIIALIVVSYILFHYLFNIFIKSNSVAGETTSNKINSNISSFVYLICFTGILVISRVLLVTYIDAMSFHAQLRYLVPVYPVFIAWITLSGFLCITLLERCLRVSPYINSKSTAYCFFRSYCSCLNQDNQDG
ncbi:membrane hypothetical protein [Desulfamplus magnetovallimortis]|uniref:Glycosyltransferase RgtA/B/C/D-like domain-containing protein n=1 Tax=Desulfamplus magnetovallimortis TaxID=1246637 RepID=A0A1W1HBS6_9BACT|nr:membrane hypothetical protein [Desulfamplus magnetovallimortis]